MGLSKIFKRAKAARSKDAPSDSPHSRGKKQKVTAHEVRELRELIRYRYTLDIEIWSLRMVRGYDRPIVEEKMKKSTAALKRIQMIVMNWDDPECFSSDLEYHKMQEIKARLVEPGKRNWEEHPPWAEEPQAARQVSRQDGRATISLHRRLNKPASDHFIPNKEGRVSEASTTKFPESQMVEETATQSSYSRRSFSSSFEDTNTSTPRTSFHGSEFSYKLRPDSGRTDVSLPYSSTANESRRSNTKLISKEMEPETGFVPLQSSSGYRNNEEPRGVDFSSIDAISTPASHPTSTPTEFEEVQSEVAQKPDNIRYESPAAEEDLGYLLDPVSYYSSLENLECRVAATCDFNRYEDGYLSEFQVDRKEINDKPQYEMTKLCAAFELLEEEQFSKSKYNILVQDHSARPDANGLFIARAIEVNKHILTDLLSIEVEARGDSISSRLKDSAALIDILQKLADSLTKLGIHQPLGGGIPQPKNSYHDPQDLFMKYFKLICFILKFGLLSYSGSHACPFDETIFGQSISTFDCGYTYVLRRRRLKCLSEYIGGPVWIFEREDTGRGEYLLSITTDQFADLWGAVWMKGPTSEPSSDFNRIFLERGIIQPTTVELSSQGEVQCHYSTKLSTTTSNLSLPLFRSDTQLLIGMATNGHNNLHHGSYFNINHDCSRNMRSVHSKRAHMFQFPGTSDDHYENEHYQFATSFGVYVTGGVSKVQKRYPGVTWKTALIRHCERPDVDLLPIMKLGVGLEVSACTFNAQRISLWKALMLANYRDRLKPFRLERRLCTHSIGDISCIEQCWNMEIGASGEDESMRKAILKTIKDIADTGIDNAGNLQVWWPFTDEPQTLRLQRDDNESHNWIQMLKDSKITATFAVISNQCLEYEYVKDCKENELQIWRGCLKSRKNRRRISKMERKDSKVDAYRTVLSTALQLHPGFAGQSKQSRDLTPLGTRLGVNGIGYLKIANEDSEQPQLAKLESGWVSKIEGNVARILAAERCNKHDEFLHSEEHPSRTMRLFVV